MSKPRQPDITLRAEPLPILDKTYLLAGNGMLFNVTGYRHPKHHFYCGLKYINGEKWTKGHEAAKTFLAREHPNFVDQYIRVPKSEIQKVYSPGPRWRQLLEMPPSELPPLLAEAVDLGHRLAQLLEIAVDEFGITDSLLWSNGHAASDIDLTVFGKVNAQRILDHGGQIYTAPDFQRPDPQVMTAPYSLDVPDWPQLLSRKYHMGSYRGRLFSLRAIKRPDELASEPCENSERLDQDPISPTEKQQVTFAVSDASHSLYFPATYRNESGDELVDYSVVYEGVFRRGDVVLCPCEAEQIYVSMRDSKTSKFKGLKINRYVIAGNCQLTSSP